jgi:NitT/TauT family transport system ATP-binding protein
MTDRAVPMVEIENVGKRYGAGQPVLDGIGLSVAKGEFVTLIGPSGCGKSTVLKLISGLTPPTSGSIQVDGMAPKDAREIVSYIFQDATLLPWRTVDENVVLGLELEGAARPMREQKTAALLELVGLGHVARSYPRQLSGGMKMRVSIARALATNPRLLLMDEPFAALDEMTRDRLNEEILRLQAEQKWTAVFVTHSVAEAIFLSTRIVVLAPSPGRVCAEFAVDLPVPRTASLRDAPEFDALAVKVSHALRAAFACEEAPVKSS